MDIKIIGAGLGGLATACLLGQQGHNVTILEKNSSPGGKINEIQAQGFRFDIGPSLLTMPFILDKLFERCGADISDFLNILATDPICRYFYPRGTEFDCFRETALNTAQIQDFAPDDVLAYKNFLSYSAQIYDHTKEAFLFNPLYGLSDLLSLNPIDFFKIDAFSTVAESIDQRFESPELRKFFKRFTTYNGSSPYKAPATLNIIPHVELTMGGYYIDGGMYALVEALIKLAKKMDVELKYNVDINQIGTQDNRVKELVGSAGQIYPADLVVSNADAYQTYRHLLNGTQLSSRKKKKMDNLEPSCSGFVLLLGTNKQYNALTHHNIFFSDDYQQEFDDIFGRKVMPVDPTIYIANTSHSNPDHAPGGGSNLFVLVNAPYLTDNYQWDEQQAEQYRDHIIRTLQKRGLTDLGDHIVYSKTITPRNFYEMYRSNSGSIYGTSSNSKLSAFMRPRNKSRNIDGLYLVGGSTHPGGGIPLVTLSAFHAVELIDRYES